MNKDRVYAYIEELDKREIMEVLDTVIRELYDDRELIVLSLGKGESRNRELGELICVLKRERKVREEFLRKH